MRRATCLSCDAKLDGQSSFCPRCGEPTPLASEKDRRMFELERWRRHQEEGLRPAPRTRVRAAAARPAATAGGPAPLERRPTRHPSPIPRPTAPRSSRRRPSDPDGPAAETKRRVPKLRLRLSRNGSASRERRRALLRTAPRVIDLEHDDPFAYRACVRCHRTDWLVRTGRREDGAWRYWCVRCSRGFKSNARLAQAAKPFVVAASILAALALLAGIH